MRSPNQHRALDKGWKNAEIETKRETDEYVENIVFPLNPLYTRVLGELKKNSEKQLTLGIGFATLIKRLKGARCANGGLIRTLTTLNSLEGSREVPVNELNCLKFSI